MANISENDYFSLLTKDPLDYENRYSIEIAVNPENHEYAKGEGSAAQLLEEMGNPQSLQGPEALIFLSRLCTEIRDLAAGGEEDFNRYFSTDDWRNDLGSCFSWAHNIDARFGSLKLTIRHKDPDEKISINIYDVYQNFLKRLAAQQFGGRTRFISKGYLEYSKEYTRSLFEAFRNGDLFLIAGLHAYDKAQKPAGEWTDDEAESLRRFVQSQKSHAEQALPELDFDGFLRAYNTEADKGVLEDAHTDKFRFAADSNYVLELPDLDDGQFADLEKKIKDSCKDVDFSSYPNSKELHLYGRSLERLLTAGIIDHQLIRVTPTFPEPDPELNLFGVEFRVDHGFSDDEIRAFNEKAAFDQQQHYKIRLPYLSHSIGKHFDFSRKILTLKERNKLRAEYEPPVRVQQTESEPVQSKAQTRSSFSAASQAAVTAGAERSQMSGAAVTDHGSAVSEPVSVNVRTVQNGSDVSEIHREAPVSPGGSFAGQFSEETVPEPAAAAVRSQTDPVQSTEQTAQNSAQVMRQTAAVRTAQVRPSYREFTPSPAKEAGKDRLMINIAHLSPHSDLLRYLGIKSLPEGQGLTLKGEDALNFVRAMHAADRARALDPGNLSNASSVDLSIALEGDDVDLLGTNVHYTLGTLAGGGSSRSLLSGLTGMSFEGNDYSNEYRDRIDRLTAQSAEQLPERDVLTVEEVPPVVHADEYAVLDQNVIDQEVIERNREREAELKNRIYLDYIPNRLYTWATSPVSPVQYDREKNQYFISSEDAKRPENIANVSKCLFRREIYADDFAGAVTDGKIALANALNVKNSTEREYAVAEALNVCAQESAANVQGAIHNFREIEQIRKMQGRPIGFFKAFSESLKFYKAVAELKKQNRISKKLTRDDYSENLTDSKEREVRNLNRRAVMRLMRQAAYNVTHSLPNRVRTAARFLQTPGADSMSYIADAVADYVTGMAMYDGKRITYGYFEDRFPLHNSQTFATDIKKHLFNGGLDLSKPEFAQLNLDIEKLCERACRLCDDFNERVSQCRGLNDQSRKTVSDELIRKADDFRQAIHTGFTRKEREQRSLRVFNGELEPLYLAVPAGQRTELLNRNNEICEEALTGALCVENTAENRRKFALYLPQITDKFEMSRDAEKMREQVRKELREAGFCEETIKNLRSGKWTVDKQNSSLSYVFNLDGVPRLQLNDFNGSLKKTVILGRPDEKQREELKANYARYRASQEALTMQQKAERSAQIAEILSSVQIPEHQEEQKYLNAKGLSIADVPNAYVDRDGSVAQKLTGFSPEYAAKTLDGALICPLTNAQGKVMSAQIIDKELNKLNLSGAPVKGAFFTVGGYDRLKDCDTILVAEGIATAASIARVAPEGVAVVACMSAGNMENVTRTLLHQFPEKGLGLMADNDIHREADKQNAGMEHAYKTKAALMPVRPNLTVRFPPLTARQLLDGKSDFNDALQVNPQAVRDRVAAAVGEIREEQKRIEAARNAAQMRVNDDFLVETAHRKGKARRA